MAGAGLTVLQLLPALEGGGVERGTLEVASGLARAGHRPLVLSGGGRMVAELESLGAEHVRWPIGEKSPLTLRLVRRLRTLVRDERVDVLHARSRVPAWIAWLAWRGMPPPSRPRLVTTFHGFYRVGRYSSVMTRAECVICVSEAIRRHVLENYPDVDPSRLTVIHRGIEPTSFPHGYRPDPAWLARWRQAHPALQGRKLLVLPGRLTRLKGHLEFLALLGDLRTRGLDVHGLIVGGKDPRRRAYAREVEKAIGTSGLADYVTCLGHRDDLREIMAVSDLVLSMSSRPESFGRTTLEALSLGRPALGYDHGGVGEILATLFPSGAVPTGNRRIAADTAAILLRSPPTVAENNRFSLAHMLTETLRLYERLASGR